MVWDVYNQFIDSRQSMNLRNSVNRLISLHIIIYKVADLGCFSHRSVIHNTILDIGKQLLASMFNLLSRHAVKLKQKILPWFAEVNNVTRTLLQ